MLAQDPGHPGLHRRPQLALNTVERYVRSDRRRVRGPSRRGNARALRLTIVGTSAGVVLTTATYRKFPVRESWSKELRKNAPTSRTAAVEAETRPACIWTTCHVRSSRR